MMKKLILAVLALGALSGTFAPLTAAETNAQAGKALWLTSLPAAQAEARKTGKIIFADFSGSDWCGWCMKLNDEVLIQKPFLEFAQKRFVLLSIDFPSRKPQPAAERQANKKLAKKYAVRGYPTVLLLDANGKEITRTGYQSGGAKAYIQHLESLLKKQLPPAMDQKRNGRPD